MDKKIVLDILWTDRAKSTFNAIVDYLNVEWSEREVRNFIQSANDLLTVIQHFSEMFKASRKRSYIRIGLITKHTDDLSLQA